MFFLMFLSKSKCHQKGKRWCRWVIDKNYVRFLCCAWLIFSEEFDSSLNRNLLIGDRTPRRIFNQSWVSGALINSKNRYLQINGSCSLFHQPSKRGLSQKRMRIFSWIFFCETNAFICKILRILLKQGEYSQIFDVWAWRKF